MNFKESSGFSDFHENHKNMKIRYFFQGAILVKKSYTGLGARAQCALGPMGPGPMGPGPMGQGQGPGPAPRAKAQGPGPRKSPRRLLLLIRACGSRLLLFIRASGCGAIDAPTDQGFNFPRAQDQGPGPGGGQGS